MAIEVKKLTREFSYNGMTLMDPGPQFTPEQVKDVYSAPVSGTHYRRGRWPGPPGRYRAIHVRTRRWREGRACANLTS